MEPSRIFGIGMISSLVTMALIVVAYVIDAVFGDDPGDVDGDMRDRDEEEKA